MSTHTPGPWATCKHATPAYAPQFGVYAELEQKDLAIVRGEQAEANARLIAAAPEMMAALAELADAGDGLAIMTTPGLIRFDDAMNDARAAIAKAKGHQ